MRSPAETAGAYFAAINARDPVALRAAFAPDGELITPAGRIAGRAAIADFYAGQAFAATDLHARPGPLLVAGPEVAVEIVLEMYGQRTRVADVFRIRDGLIERLAVYLGGPA
jgi:ketosteroid isomerase-like protein